MAGVRRDKKAKDAQVRATINQKLIESGEKEKLKDLLRTRLIECGWREELKAYAKEVIKNKGLEHITVEELVSEITPRGRGTLFECAWVCAVFVAMLTGCCADSNGTRRGEGGAVAADSHVPCAVYVAV